MEDFMIGLKNGAIIGIGIMVFMILFQIWLIPTVIADKKGLESTTKGAIWILLILSIFCPPVWLIALVIAYSCGK